MQLRGRSPSLSEEYFTELAVRAPLQTHTQRHGVIHTARGCTVHAVNLQDRDMYPHSGYPRSLHTTLAAAMFQIFEQTNKCSPALRA